MTAVPPTPGRIAPGTADGAAKRILLVSPAFHNYWASYGDALARRGHQVRTVLYDNYATVGEKTRLKLGVEIPERLHVPQLLGRAGDVRGAERRRRTDDVLAVLREYRPSHVLVIKGDMLDERFWEEIEATPRVLLLYDDLARHDYTPQQLAQIGPVAHYSRIETAMLRDAGVDAHHVALAFDPHRAQPPTRRTGEIVFVGAGYENRRRILLDLADRGLPVHAWGRDFSRHLMDRARTFSWHRPDISSSRDVPLEEAYRIHGSGAAAVTIHGAQTGLAMRTFEVSGIGGVQLVDRDDVAEHYDIGTEVAVWHDADELAELATRAVSDVGWGNGLRAAGRARTLAEHTFDHRIAEVDQLWD